MKLFQVKNIYYCLSIVLIISCGNKKDNSKKIKEKIIAAKIGSITITQKEVDYFVKQKLYDELNRIHLIREVALNKIIENKIIESQAKNNNISVDKLINDLYLKKKNKLSLKQFVVDNEYDKNGINTIEKNLVNYDITSEKGNNLLLEKFKFFILSKYIDSLKTRSDIKIFMKPPIPPKVEIDQSLVHLYGNISSKITFIEVSDFECDMCREYNHIFKQLFDKYKDDVAFGFVNYGSYVSKPAIASEIAGMQGKFWEMKELLFKENEYSTYSEIESLALRLNLDIEKFKKDFNNINLENKLKKSYDLIHKSGIYGTPTILINYRIMHNSSSMEELESFLMKKIEESKK